MGSLRRRGVGDGDELQAWLDSSYASAYRTAYLILGNRQDAEEAVQDAFLRAWRFRTALPPGGDAPAQPWLYRVVVNSCLSKLRSDRSRRDHTRPFPDWGPDGLGPAASPDDQPELVVEAADTRDALLEALNRLPDHLRTVVVLRFYAQLSEREIARAIGRRPGTVKSRLHEAKSRLGADPTLGRYRAVPVGGVSDD